MLLLAQGGSNPPKRLLHAPVLMARCERGSFGSLRSRCLSYVARRSDEGLSLFRTRTGALPLSEALVCLSTKSVLLLIRND